MTDHAASGQPSPRLEEVLALLRGKVDSAQQPALEAFVRRYYAGVDPEYLWYPDKDGDGVVCERERERPQR